MRKLGLLILIIAFTGVAAQVRVGPETGEFGGATGPVSISITSPETGAGLGPKFELNQEFVLGFKLQITNLTVENIRVRVLMFDDANDTYVAFNPDWIVDAENTTWDLLRGPTLRGGLFRIRIPERGYYMLKVRGNYTMGDRSAFAEGGDIISGPRIRVIPGLSDKAYATLVGMPFIPLAIGIAVRWFRRNETRKRRRGEPAWMKKLKSDEKSKEN